MGSAISPPRQPRPLPRPRRCRLAPVLAVPVLAVPAIALAWAAPVRSEVQLRCDGTLLEARGNAELERATRRLEFSLALQASAADADAALAQLQQRLAAVRRALQSLQVQELRVSSPSTWTRPAEASRPAQVEANLQISGRLAPERLQGLVRTVGALPGVRLSPVQTIADAEKDVAVRRQLLRSAYRDALAQAREVADAIGRSQLEPLTVLFDGGELRPMAMRMAADAAPGFDPAELPTPRSRLSLLVRFCAR